MAQQLRGAVQTDGRPRTGRGRFYQRSLAIQEKVLGPNHRDVATSLNNLALLHQTKSDYARAEPLFQRSLAIWEKVLGPNHPDVAMSLNNLALLYLANNAIPRAVQFQSRATPYASGTSR